MSKSVDIQKDDLLLFGLKNMPSGDSLRLYHYTSPEGLFNIIKTNKLWFTRYDCLNDYTEREYILDVLKSVCLKMRNEGKISSEIYVALTNVTLDKKNFCRW